MARTAWILAAASLAAAGCGGSRLVGGAGGTPGSGGAPCTAANGCLSAAGGDAGSGRPDGAGDASCDQLSAAYVAVLNAARACTPGARGQCQAIAALSLTACPDFSLDWEYVNDTTLVKPALQSWRAACPPTPSTEENCPETLEEQPHAPPSTCIPTTHGAVTGTCTAYGADAAVGIAPDGGESCDQLAADYVAAVIAGHDCTPGAPNQCRQIVTAGVAYCDGTCPTWVAVKDPSDGLDALSRWDNQCRRACDQATSCGMGIIRTGACVAVDGGSPAGGTCMVIATPGDGGVTGCDIGEPLVGAAYDINKSRFAFGSTPTDDDSSGFARWVGVDGVVATEQSGGEIGTLNAGAPEASLPDWSDDQTTLIAHVSAYFATFGVTACQVGNASVLGGSGGRTVALARAVDGIKVAESVAYARFDNQDQSTSEGFYWPTIPTGIVANARALQAMLAYPTALAAYKATLPADAQGDGVVTIHHTGAASTAKFNAAATYDVQSSPGALGLAPVLSFDMNGNPVSTSW